MPKFEEKIPHRLSRRVRIIALCQDLEYFHVLKALRGADPEQHTEPIHKFNLEHLLVFKAPCRDNPQVQSGTPPFLSPQKILRKCQEIAQKDLIKSSEVSPKVLRTSLESPQIVLRKY